jgi:hypothetical protein
MPENEPQRDISEGRKLAFYGGMVLSGVGILLFMSNFVMGPDIHDGFSEFQSGMHAASVRAISGMALIAVGAIISAMGKMGAAGSGVILDPRKSRKDLEPWNRAQGGMINDALEEMPALKNIVSGDKPGETVVKVRCRDCGALNEEDAKFCKACGKQM